MAEGFGSFSNNLRWTIDASSQQWQVSASDGWSDLYAVGLDVHKVFTASRGDLGTLILQPYLLWLPGDGPRPPFFDGNETALTWRIANLNWALASRGRMNFRIGHFEVPFGLEHEIDTNGTLRQYSNPSSLGFKADWGVSVNGLLEGVQYEMALTRGTGQEYHDNGNPFAVSARFGTAFDGDRSFGIALFDGRVETASGLIERTRLGLDARAGVGPFGLLGEVAYGQDGDDGVVSWLAELNRTNPAENVLAYVQASRLRTVLGDTDALSVGLRWLASRRVTLSSQFRHGRRPDGAVNNESRFLFRYRL